MMQKLSLWLPVMGFAVLSLSSSAHATGPIRITGALSNFDCYNDTPDDCDGFEIEIEGKHKEDVTGTWDYSTFGGPTIEDIGTPTAPYLIIKYFNANAVVVSGGVTHFGVHLNGAVDPGKIHYSWLPKATVVQPNPYPVPVTLPIHKSLLVSSAIRDTVTNELTNPGTMWVLPYMHLVRRKVGLDELMPTTQLIKDGIPYGDGPKGTDPVRLDPGDVWQNDDATQGDDDESGVFSFKIYEDIVTYDALGNDLHRPGKLITNMMNATETSSTITNPVALNQIYLSDTSVTGTQVVQGMVTIAGEAPAVGSKVTITSDDVNAVPPLTATIKGNSSDVLFNIKTKAVSTTTTVNITATLGGVSKTQTFMIQPPTLNQVWLNYVNAKGGTTVSGKVYIVGPAPAAGLVVLLASDSLFGSVPATVKIAAGKTSAAFYLKTKKVTVTTPVNVTASFNGATVSSQVRLIP